MAATAGSGTSASGCQRAFGRTYPAFNPLAYSLDVFVPFVSFGYEDHWRPKVSGV